MSINESEITVGGVYKTPNNQERVVVAIEDDIVKYSPRGGNVQNPFDQMQKSKKATFADACSEKIADMPQEKFDEIESFFKGRGLIK
ncbi:hypothetical protein [Enterobacter ludwigii]|uniref:hypothetical protein n=1 Tax=Enterobacter ludwigii TaxID=299767 RepID=UPI0013D3680A|nr:hypothetical protein [Enterobacter ludwigii]